MSYRKTRVVLTVVVAVASLGPLTSAEAGRNICPSPLPVAEITHSTSAQDPANQKTEPIDFLCGLKPLVSTRADVEPILGKGRRHPNGFTYIYENERQRVDVLYSAGPCKLSGVERWSVPEDTVIRLEISPKQNILLETLDLDPKKYTRFKLSHPDNWVQYWNREDGLIVQTIIYGKVEELYLITREPPAKDKSLKCASP